MPTLAVTIVQALLEGIANAPSLITSATTLVNMFSAGSITDAQLTAIWAANVQAVKDAEAAWAAANAGHTA